MAAGREPGKNNPPRTSSALTLKAKHRIKALIGKCEYCDSIKSPEELEVYQFGPMMQPDYRGESDPVRNLIVLCREHHARVLAGEISKSSIKSKIAGRMDKKKKELRSCLQKQERTYEGAGVTRIRDPARFHVSLPGHADHNR